MNYLQIARRVARACGMTSSAQIPTTVLNQTGNLLDAVDWVADAWRELQASDANWRWMQSRFSGNTVANKDTYAPSEFLDSLTGNPISRFGEWRITDRKSPPKAFLTSGGQGSQYFLQYLEWDRFQTLYRIGYYPPAMPAHITIDPQNNIVLGPAPNDVYTISGEYQRGVLELVNDTDEPDMPDRFHMVVVYDAMRKYGGSEAAQEVLLRVQTEGASLKSSLRLDQLPRIRRSSPLA